MMTPYENLANAIIIQAYKDYIAYYKKLRRLETADMQHMSERFREKHRKKIRKARQAFDEVIDFFYSPWYGMLTSVDPNIIMDKLDEEVSAL